MRIFGKHVFPRQIIVFCSGLLVLASTTYDVHRSIKNNREPPSQEQVEALEEYIKSVRSNSVLHHPELQNRSTDATGRTDKTSRS